MIGLVTGIPLGAPGGGAVAKEAPTGISQRWPGCPCSGLGSVTTAPDVGACTCMGSNVGSTAAVVSAGVAPAAANVSDDGALSRRGR